MDSSFTKYIYRWLQSICEWLPHLDFFFNGSRSAFEMKECSTYIRVEHGTSRRLCCILTLEQHILRAIFLSLLAEPYQIYQLYRWMEKRKIIACHLIYYLKTYPYFPRFPLFRWNWNKDIVMVLKRFTEMCFIKYLKRLNLILDILLSDAVSSVLIVSFMLLLKCEIFMQQFMLSHCLNFGRYSKFIFLSSLCYLNVFGRNCLRCYFENWKIYISVK